MKLAFNIANYGGLVPAKLQKVMHYSCGCCSNPLVRVRPVHMKCWKHQRRVDEKYMGFMADTGTFYVLDRKPVLYKDDPGSTPRTMISLQSRAMLKELSEHYGLPMRAIIDQLVENLHHKVFK